MVQNLVSLIFPYVCTGCGREGAWLCSRCAQNVQFRVISRPRTGSLERLISLIPYSDKKVNKLIRKYKFKKARTALPTLQSLVRRGTSPALIPAVDVVAPLPLFRIKFHERGFNQAAGIAEALARVLGAPCDQDLLLRQRGGGQQSKKTDADRRKPLKDDTFLVSKPARVFGRRVLLVDDVYTTGATMSAAASALRRVGARSVIGFALSYGG